MVCIKHARPYQLHGVCYATRDRLVRDAEPLLRTARAIQRALHWIYTQFVQEIAAVISSFPTLDIGEPTAALARYQSQSCGDAIWFFPRTALIVCGNVSCRAGLPGRPTPYAACVDNVSPVRTLTE
jgi:hypothetical protein